MEYDLTGMMRTHSDNNGDTTVNTQPGTQYAVPTQITANGYSTTLNWTSILQLDTQTGPNGETVNFDYDSGERPSKTTSPYGAETTYTYSTTAPQVKATTGSRWTKTYKDGFGRTVKTESGYTQGSTDTVVSIVETEYAACACTPMGKVKRVSRPYAPGQTTVWTEYVYDELGRVKEIKPPANSGTGYGTSTTYAYAGNTVTVTEPGGNWKKFTTDAFGNLTRVDEPRPGGGATYATTYGYTPLNQLWLVAMNRDGVGQTRTFAYHVNGKLATTGFPEHGTAQGNGTTTYTYNSNGELIQKQDPKGQKIKYEYDAKHRLQVVRRYPAGSANEDANQRTTYYYDTNPWDGMMNVGTYTSGRLAAVEYGTPLGPVREGYKYHQAGAMTLKRMDQGSTSWRLEAGYTYDNEGRLVTMTYPNNGKTYTQAYDAAGRPNGMTHVEGGSTVNDAWGVVYNAAGQLTSLAYRFENFDYSQGLTYNNRGQLTNLTISKTTTVFPFTTTPMSNLQYNYPAVNAGRIDSMQNELSGETVTYQYDVLSRLTAANAQQWTQQYTYDGFGNLYKKTGTGLAASWNVDYTSSLVSSKNQIGTHDANGNPTGLSFDVDNRLSAQSGWTGFGYAPDNKRVVRVKPEGGGQYKEITFYSGNRRLGRYKVSFPGGGGAWDITTLQEEHYFAGRRLSPQDRLSSVADARLLPYGEELSTTANGRTKFATYFRDDWGYDYADQRYYSQRSGRFLTPDPYIASGGQANPGSWNRYAYVEGDPVNYVDPTGLIAARTMCTAGFSTEECFGPGGPLSGEMTRNGNGGMYCDQAVMPFITTAAECGAYSSLVWHGVPSGVAQSILPVIVGAGGAVITGSSGVTVGSVIAGITGILGGIGIGEWIYQASRGRRDGEGKRQPVIGRPKDGLPTGTKPIDQTGWDKETVHEVKRGVGAGPRDWVGVDEEGNIWTGSPTGEAINHGPWEP